MDAEGLHIHLDLVGGMAGDMFVAAAVDAGLVERTELEAVLRKVGLGPVEVVVEQVMRGAIEGTRIEFRGWDEDADAEHRHLSTIRTMLAESDLPQPVCRRATAMFQRLGEAEAAVHGIAVEDVHFHEVGAVDSILDFVAAAWIVECAGVKSWSVGQIPVGSGTIDTAHGTIPVPAPATARVLEGFDVAYRDIEAELVTPTGATIAAAVAGLKGPRRGTMVASGFGCGSRDLGAVSNVLRMVVLKPGATGESLGDGVERDEVVQLITEIDDATPEVVADAARRVRKQGALDVVREPVHMKKGRTGIRLSVLCRPEDESALVRCIFRETTTLGIRRLPLERWVLRRSMRPVSTPYGEVTLKVAWWGDEVLRAIPEFDSCVERAAEAGVAVQQVYSAALAQARRRSEWTDEGSDDEPYKR